MIYFNNWELTADCEVLARQHDNLTRSITVTGDLPPETGRGKCMCQQVGTWTFCRCSRMKPEFRFC